MRILKQNLLIIVIAITHISSLGLDLQEAKITDSKGNPVPEFLLVKTSFDLDETPIFETLNKLAEKGGFHLNYSTNIFQSDQSVSIHLKDTPIASILYKILEGTNVGFIVTNNDQVVLFRFKKINRLNYTISGFVTDAETGEALLCTNVYIENQPIGCTSNIYGFYSLTIPEGIYSFKYSYVGYETKVIDFNLNQNIIYNIELNAAPFSGDTVIVIGDIEENFTKTTEIGTIKLLPKKLSLIPVLFGEQDILKTIQLLPGVTLTREGDSGFHVRGGNSDQNLILLDEAPVHNAFHFFGFFSVFNSDAIKDVKLIKGSAPPKYGGKLSSVLDIQMNEGNFKEFHGNGGVGLIFSRLTLEGPLVKNKSSYIISARRTYADIFTSLSSTEEVNKSALYFYDFNLKTNYRLSQNDRLYLSGYFGRDVLGFSGIFRNSWGNETATLRWNHLFSDKLFLNSSLVFSNFIYTMKVDPEEGNEDDGTIEIENIINAFTIKEDFQYFMDARNTFNFGLQYVFYNFLPGNISVSGRNAFDFSVGKRKADDRAVYMTHEFKAMDKLKISYGLRYTSFLANRVGDSFDFTNIEDPPDLIVGEKEGITYDRLEPRLNANYEWNETTSFKLGYARNYQNVHSISNSTAGTPLQIWQPSSRKVKPQRADQVSLGYFRNLGDNTYDFSIEVFYKDMQNQVDFKNGANIFFSSLFESELVFGSGRAYGVEFLLKKKLGKLTGWIGYSIAKAEKKFSEINQGKPFPTKYDRTHDFSFVGIYKFNHKWSLATNWVYYTGNALTIPYEKYQINGRILKAYTERNAFRMPAYHRLDFNLTYTTKGGNSWNFSLYNAYGRKNAYALIFRDDNEYPIKLSLFSFLPSMSYNFKF